MMTEFSLLRRHAGITIAELASQLGFPEDQINDWDEGRSTAPKHIIRLLDYLSGSETSAQPEVQHGFPWASEQEKSITKSDARTGAFTDNMKLPIHRWFRYSAGFSAEWVAGLVAQRKLDGVNDLIFDPFAGSGTSMLAAQAAGVPSAGAEKHPFVFRIAHAKLSWNSDIRELRVAAEQLLTIAKKSEGFPGTSSDLLARCYSPEALKRLLSLRSAFLAADIQDPVISQLVWLAITSVLRECSGVGTAQWQYILPNKSKARVVDPYAGFLRRVEMMAGDIASTQRTIPHDAPDTRLEFDDARELSSFGDLAGRVTCVITSPPYPNNYDYADATRLEMTYWGEVESWGDLHRTVRHHLVRSCSQHSAAERLELDKLLDDPVILPIKAELSQVCRELEEVRKTRGGKKTYHTMVAAYFADLARVWHALRPLCADGADVCFVIGDSAPYGVYVPVDKWLVDLAEAAGFHSPRFEKIRDRNLKWKNRKHRVPLKEGNLWLRA